MIHDLIWKASKFLYLHNMSKERKLYTQQLLTKKIEEIRLLDTKEQFTSFISKGEEFIIWAKENQEVHSVWTRLFISGYTVYLKLDVLLCKFVYSYFHNEYEKVNFRNAIADLMYECKSQQYKDLEISKVKLKYLKILYQWLCKN